ncbi:uncharacterized protein EKO05_0004605 [Ascochyta rabiei]|uniref:Heme binding n=1 Tax=Didymella rabiei TaxID=5454 RepID=A0A163EZL1_DIDRA|nr:uncharacterized protein EKO05_0004605 [Ascochyta rabiei]KZM24039.1 heme binding [Ascochyta rabiei]UPX14114.1 hypothetical protein EKO05_0004605 [Ascochyta rabiei]
MLSFVHPFQVSLLEAASTLLLVCATYAISLAVYRVYLHPLSKYPGPKLAAATQWYEFYFDVLKRGRFAWEIKRMHDLYGPVVRINPHELHVSEPEFYDELYAGPTKKRNKYNWAYDLAMVEGSAWTTLDNDLHRKRRAPLAPYFSLSAIRQFDPVIREKLKILDQKLEKCRDSNKVICLDDAFVALATDIITQYAFGVSQGLLEADEFNPGWLKLLRGTSEQSLLTKHVPWLVRGLRRVPVALLLWLEPQVAEAVRFSEDVQRSLDNAISDKHKRDSHNVHPTIFHELLNSDLPASERSPKRLLSEGLVVVAAGTLTSAHYLKTTAYHILANPAVLERLQEELETVMPDAEVLPPFQDLNQLPYFNAVINEGFRLTHGVITRLTRIAPTEALHVPGTTFTIPAGTPTSMSSWLVHLHPALFPSPDAFRPERWLEPGAERLKKHLVNFIKGSRVCLGKDLARAEIVYTLALLVRRWAARGREGMGMRLWETTRRDVEIERDFFNPFPALDSQGARVVFG